MILFGVHKDGETLATLLPKDRFDGVLVSDDASVYRDFTLAQECWAHLLRKAIRLTLLLPGNEEYRTFLTGLLALYRKASRLQQDRRLKSSTRKKKALAKTGVGHLRLSPLPTCVTVVVIEPASQSAASQSRRHSSRYRTIQDRPP